MEFSETIRTLRSAGEVTAVCRQLTRCAEDVAALAQEDPLLAAETAEMNTRLLEAVAIGQAMMKVLTARVETA